MRACLLLAVLTASGCLPWYGAVARMEGSLGGPPSGLLLEGGQLPARGGHFRFYRSLNRRYGTSALTETVRSVADYVALRFPGSVLLVGDLSAPRGGRLSGHRSHRSGRDVDFAFFVTDLKHRDTSGFPLICFDRFGVGKRDGKGILFDTARNWMVVEALLGSDRIAVQWIFVSDGLKARLLRWAVDNNRDLEIVKRASFVLKQPRDALPHDDHFHVRVYCPLDSEGEYCRDMVPFWPWAKVRSRPSKAFTREQIVRLALEE